MQAGRTTRWRSRLAIALVPVVIVVTATPFQAQRRGGAPQRRDDAVLERIMIPGGPLAGPEGELKLVADLYAKAPADAPLLVLFHGTNGSRGEFRKAGPVLNGLGYNALAVDMRLGGRMDFVRNLTRPQLVQHGIEASVLDLKTDMESSLAWARERFPESRILAVGSGASATLALAVAAEHPELADGLVLFSPPIGYFEQFGKPADWARTLAGKVDRPTFLTGLRSSREGLLAVHEALATERKVHFEPEGPGIHGARALWPKEPLQAEYWAALKAFLKANFPVEAAPALIDEGSGHPEGNGGSGG